MTAVTPVRGMCVNMRARPGILEILKRVEIVLCPYSFKAYCDSESLCLHIIVWFVYFILFTEILIQIFTCLRLSVWHWTNSMCLFYISCNHFEVGWQILAYTALCVSFVNRSFSSLLIQLWAFKIR